MTPQVFHSVESSFGRFAPCALAIGNFDGVHVGHQALIRAACEYSKRNGLVPAVLTFHPHPSAILGRAQPANICTLDERIRLLFAAGAEQVMVLPFTLELSRLSPAEFVRKYLVEALSAKAVFVGENFRFGHKQSGNTSTLSQLGGELGFVPQFLAPVTVRGEVVSSSAIRKHLQCGNVSRASRLLGRCFSVTGPVVSGQGIGSKQTVPTLNQSPVPGLVLPPGIFVTETFDLDNHRWWPSVTSVGTNPTFEGQSTTVETYLLSQFEPPTPASIEVRFRYWLRREERFPSAETLKAQILLDVARADAYWRHMKALCLGYTET